MRAYDPALHVRSDRFDFDHGSLRLHGPVDVTPELAAAAALPAGTTAYYADVIETGTRGSRPDYVKWQDAERLVRGLAMRLGGTVHGERPLMDLKLAASVYAGRPVPAEQVISVLQRYANGDLFVEEYQDVPGSYFLLSGWAGLPDRGPGQGSCVRAGSGRLATASITGSRPAAVRPSATSGRAASSISPPSVLPLLPRPL